MHKFWVVGLLWAFAACDCGGVKTNANEGELSLSPDLQFGILGVGETLTRGATLKNVGAGRLNVQSVATTAPFSSCIAHLDGTCDGLTTLASGEEATVNVTYAPTVANLTDTENHAADVVATSDAPVHPVASIHVVGHAVPARLSVSPSSLDYGPLEVGANKQLTLTFANKGVQDVVLSGAKLGSASFQADLTKIPAKLARDGSFTLPITYAPPEGRDDVGTFEVTTDIGVESKIVIPLTGKGLLAKVTLCYGFEGGTQSCLPDAKGGLAGELDFGALDSGASKRATLTLKNEGNVQVDLFGLADSKNAQAADVTAGKNPCALTPAPAADFTFTPSAFGVKLPEDPTAADPAPSKQQTLSVSYSPQFHCPPTSTSSGDVADRAVISLKAGAAAGAPSFFLDLKGSSKLGLAQAGNVYWDVKTPQPKDYQAFNTGPGPLQITGVEFVEAPDDTDCATGCAQRIACANSTRSECSLFTWDAPFQAATLPGAAAGLKTSAVVGRVLYSPGAFCGGGSDASVCYSTQLVRICTRVSSDDPFQPVVCGELKGKTF